MPHSNSKNSLIVANGFYDNSDNGHFAIQYILNIFVKIIFQKFKNINAVLFFKI